MGDPAIDVLIVGGGPTGLTLAIDLVRRGLDVRVVDRASDVFEGSRAKGVQPRTLEVFSDLGVVDAIVRHGCDVPTIGVHLGPVTVPLRPRRKKPSDDVPYPNIWLIPQSATNRALHDRLRELGGSVEFGRELLELTQDEDIVRAKVAGPRGAEEIHARYLVGADGGSSCVRKQLGIEFVGSTDEDDRMAIVDAAVTGLSRDRWHVWIHPGGTHFTAFPLPHRDLFQIVFRLSPGEEPALDEDSLNERLMARRRHRAMRIGDVRWASVYRPNIRLAQSFRRGRVFIGGDAAHVHTPAGGQGLNTGIQDGYNLGWKIAQVLAGADPTLLDSYQSERRPIAASVLGLSTEKYGGMKRFKPSSFRRGDEVKQLGLSYRGGPLAPGGADRTQKLLVGDRAPDASLTTPAGTSVRLHEILSGPHFTAVAHGPSAVHALDQVVWPPRGDRLTRVAIDAPGGLADFAVTDANGSFTRAYGLTGDTLLLVRPDGYIGHIATSRFIESTQSVVSVMTPVAAPVRSRFSEPGPPGGAA